MKALPALLAVIILVLIAVTAASWAGMSSLIGIVGPRYFRNGPYVYRNKMGAFARSVPDTHYLRTAEIAFMD